MVKFLQINQDNQESAFSLIEVLVVLAIKVIMLTLIAPVIYSQITDSKLDYFFEELRSDINLVQSENYLTDDFYELTFYQESYKLVKNSTQQLIKENKYPDNVTIETRVFSSIVYQHNGTFKTPGRVIFYQGKKKYELIFPFGKGGFYLVVS